MHASAVERYRIPNWLYEEGMGNLSLSSIVVPSARQLFEMAESLNILLCSLTTIIAISLLVQVGYLS